MKRILALILAALLLCSMCVVAWAETPEVIECVDDFYKLIDNPDGHFILNSDLRAIATIGICPEFRGTLDGQGHTVTGLALMEEAMGSRNALIGVNKGTIKNLHIKNANIEVNLNGEETLYTQVYSGVIAGDNEGTIQNCSVEGRVISNVSGDSMTSFVGGIAGRNSGTVENCFSSVTVTATNNNAFFIRAGGLVGQNNEGAIQQCLSVGSASATSTVANDSLDAGVAVGHNYFGSLTGVYGAAERGEVLGHQQVSHSSDTYANLDAAALKLESSFTGFDFETIWEMGPNHPTLQKACAHQWNDGVITTEPTATTNGIRTFTCTVCSETKTEIIPAIGVEVSKKFKDIKKNDWFYNAVDYAVNNNLFAGTSETTFGPNDKMTRAMFVSVLGRLDGVTVNHKVTTAFTDVKKNQYYTGYVKWANENQIVAGTSETTFGPDANITREQICAMMVRYCGFADIELEQKNAAIAFKDAGDISSYARAAVKACQMGGLVNGEKADGRWIFRPKGNATRAEVATIMMNFAKTYK